MKYKKYEIEYPTESRALRASKSNTTTPHRYRRAQIAIGRIQL